MNEQHLKNFIALVAFDQNLLKADDNLINLEKQRLKILEEIEQLKHRQLQIAQKKHDFIKMQHEQELKLKELQDQESHLSANAQAVSNTREYDAVLKELERVRAQCTQQEQKMMHSLNRVETVIKEIEATDQEVANQTAIFLEELKQNDLAIIQAKTILDSVTNERVVKTTDIPQEWLNIYQNMQGKIKNPVVPIEQESCSACFYCLSSRDLQTLKNGGLMQCKDCYRFIYFQK
jgi:uncharacterized protein